jgi:ribose 5-phosphate isomerase B
MKIAVGSDHRGLEFKRLVMDILGEMGYQARDFGSYTTDSVDYPDIARTVCESVVKSEFDRGILICGTGIGMSIAANKVRGIRAALCCDAFGARRARQHNDANVLCLGAERAEAGVKELLKTFLATQFEGGHHQRRLEKISAMETQDLAAS